MIAVWTSFLPSHGAPVTFEEALATIRSLHPSELGTSHDRALRLVLQRIDLPEGLAAGEALWRDPDGAKAVIRSAGQVPSPWMVEKLLCLLDEGDPAARADAIVLLGWQPGARAHEALLAVYRTRERALMHPCQAALAIRLSQPGLATPSEREEILDAVATTVELEVAWPMAIHLVAEHLDERMRAPLERIAASKSRNKAKAKGLLKRLDRKAEAARRA